MDKPLPPDDDGEESERERRVTNLFLLGAAILVVGGGIWLRAKTRAWKSGKSNSSSGHCVVGGKWIDAKSS